MKSLVPIIAGLLAVTSAHAAGEAKPQEYQQPTVLRDVQYGVVGGVPLLMDISIPNPAPSRPVPIIVFFHGGGWSGGSREDMMSRCDLVSRQGYIGASVEYRLSAVAPFPAQLQDCKCAVRYLRANAARYGIDANRMAVWGCSAGGHLAAMVGLTENIAEFDGNGGNPGVSSRVQLVVDCFGPTDFVAWQDEVNKWANDLDARALFAPPPGDPGMINWWRDFGLERDAGVVKLFEGKARERAAWASPVTYADGSKDMETVAKAQRWQDQDAYRRSIAGPASRWSLIESGAADDWVRGEYNTTGLALTIGNDSVTGKSMAYEVQNMDGWGTYVKAIPAGLFGPMHNALALWAKGDANTPEVLLEVDERDGTRWIYTLRVTPEWRYYEVPFVRFTNLYDPGATSRRLKIGEKLNGRLAAKVSIGLARGLTALTPGPHRFWIDGLGSTRTRLATPPKFLVVHGANDTWVPVQQGVKLANKLDSAGADVTVILKPNMGHDESKAFPEIIEHLKQVFPLEQPVEPTQAK